MLRDLLVEHGIEAYVVEGTSSEAPNPSRVMVNSVDAELAAGVVEIFERHVLTVGGTLAPHPDDRREGGTVDASVWPACLGCGRPRLTLCPVCQTAGFDLPWGELPEGITAAQIADRVTRHGAAVPRRSPTDGSEECVLVLCTTCDEPFAAEYFRRCGECGYEHSSGLEGDPDIDRYPLVRWEFVVGSLLLVLFGCGLYLLASLR